MSWHVIAEPHEEYEYDEGKNLGGLKVLLVNGDEKKEVARVGYDRKHTTNKKQSFGAALQNEIKKAQEAADTINSLLDSAPPSDLK